MENPFAFQKPTKPANLLNPVVLAYMGDAVYEMLIRQYLISLPNHKPHHLHKSATSFVSAKAQRRMLEAWQEYLTEDESEIVRRGRNSKSGSPPKNADVADYRHATALESLVGYLYYEGRIERIGQLLQIGIDSALQQDNKKG